MKKILIAVAVLGAAVLLISLLGNGGSKKDVTNTNGSAATGAKEATTGAAAVPKGSRTLAIHVIDQVGSSKGVAAYDALFQSALDAGVQSVNISLNWNDVEASGGALKPEVFAQVNRYFASHHAKMDLDLRPVDTAGVMLPDDLKGKALNDPEVIRRFEAFLDHVFAALPDVQLNMLAIGNEVDTVFANNPAQFAEYDDFLKQVIPYAKQKRPGVRVGVIVAYAGLTGKDAKEYQKLNARTDVVMLTYYPIKGDFSTKQLPVFEQDLAKVTALYPNRQLYFTEIGYPSSEISGGSEAKQAQFIREMFSVWDKHADTIAGLAYFMMGDLTPASIEQLTKYFSVATKQFKATIGSVGLVTADGREKEALGVFRKEAHERGW